MNTYMRIVQSILIVIALVAAFSAASHGKEGKIRAGKNVNLIEHGRYLVHQVGMCIDCHSPRDEKGQFIENRHLVGTQLDIAPTVPMPWALVAPNLAGLPPHYKRETMVRFLVTGERPGGLPPPLPPMPEFRMNPKDAAAVASYLESLGR